MRKSSLKRAGLLQFLISCTLILAVTSCSLFLSTPSLPARHALLIGIADYQSTKINNLIYTDDDARSMAKLLKAQDFDVRDTRTLIDSDASKAGIISAITDFLESVPTGDYALIYYSGHGVEDSGTSYLVPYDYDLGPNSNLISEEELANLFSIHAKTDNLIFIADSCFSGGFIPDTEVLDAVHPNYSASQFLTKKSFPFFAFTNLAALVQNNTNSGGGLVPMVLSAAGSLEYSYESPSFKDTDGNGHGVFTYFLLESAQKGDSNGDGYVTATEAYNYTVKNISERWNLTNAQWDYDFYPHISGGIRDIVLFTTKP